MPKSATRTESEAGQAGAKAGAKARKRERTQADAAIEATLAAESGKPGSWTYSYSAGMGDRREATIREGGRREVAAAELLAMAREAARLAAGRLRARHGIPELSLSEQADLASDLVMRLLVEANPAPAKGHLPKRADLTKSYLVTRCEGIVLNDPERRADGDMDDGGDLSPVDLLASADAQAREKGSRRDPMLTLPGEKIIRKRHGKREAAIVPKSLDPVNPSLRAGLAACELPSKAQRAAAYLVHGGRVADDWSAIWGTSPGYAKTRIVPEGCALLRSLDPTEAADLAGAIATAAAPDRLDRRYLRQREIERGGAAHRPDRVSVSMPWRDRIVPGDRHGRIGPAVPETRVMAKTNKSIIIRSDRTRAQRAKQRGWTAPTV